MCFNLLNSLFILAKMQNHIPTKQHLREALLFCYNLKKSAAEAHQLMKEAYSEHALSEPTCREWYRRFKANDFGVQDKERSGQPKKFEDDDLLGIIKEDPCLTLEEIGQALNVDRSTAGKRLHALGMIQKYEKWLPHKLTERQQENRKTICEMLLARHSFLHRLVTGDEKWVWYENPKRRKSWTMPGEPSTSTVQRWTNRSKVLLCIWWDQTGVLYYELLKPSETVTGDRYKHQLLNLRQAIDTKRPQYGLRHDRIILQHDNARPHLAKQVKETLKILGWEVLPHPPYSPDISPSDFYLFRSMQHSLAGLTFNSYEDIEKWIDQWIATKDRDFFYRGIHSLHERWSKVIVANGKYFD